jgi:16S rRNA (cytosine967-C5)-methyltransferase
MGEPRSSREVALEVLDRVDADRAWSGVLLRRLLDDAHVGAAEAALATELVYGTLRHRAEVDWSLRRFTRTSLDALPSPIRAILRMGAYQLLFVPRIPPHAACFEAVALAKRAGTAGTARLVNAVLRRVAESPEGPRDGDTPMAIALRYSHPEWLVARWCARFGTDGARALCAVDNTPPPSAVRLNTLRGTPASVASHLTGLGVYTAPSPWLVEGRRIVPGPKDENGSGPAAQAAREAARRTAYREGWFAPQDEASMLVGRLVAPHPGEIVIDACAAPGGKTTHLAALMENRGRVIACDVHRRKTDAVSAQCARLGATIVEPLVLDAASLGEMFPHAADRVLVDAPCSGLGVLRRRPEIKWRARPEDFAGLASEQGRILAGASGAVRSGGTLVYSVCSIEPEEGSEVVSGFLASHPEFEPLPITAWPPGPDGTDSAPRGAVAWSGVGAASLWPHCSNTDGFFVAAFRRAT